MSIEVKKISWWHEQLVDWMLLNPDKRLKDAAVVFGVTEQYIYMLKNSDTFKEYWARRRATREGKLDDGAPQLLGSLQEKLSTLAEMSLDQMLEQIELNSPANRAGHSNIAHDELRDTAEMALKRLGYGAPAVANGPAQPGTPQVNVTINANLIAEAREKMKQLHGVTPAAPVLELQVDPEVNQDKST